jgi:hypothetical protein
LPDVEGERHLDGEVVRGREMMWGADVMPL